jgi:site-specific DNA-methyltransferase (adenine-specific)
MVNKRMTSTAYNLDCMEALKAAPDNHWDLAVCDPPYGLGDRLCNGGMLNVSGRLSGSSYKGREWDTPPTWDYFYELRRVSANQIIWGGNYFTLSPTRGFIIWDKQQPLDTRSFGEFAWTSFDRPAKCFRYMYTNYVGGDANKIHPTQKPVALYKWILTNYAKPGQTILDTHLGSGSSRIAAYDLGFDFTGYELDKDYFDAQEKRFADHIAQPRLFEPVTVAEQENLFA